MIFAVPLQTCLYLLYPFSNWIHSKHDISPSSLKICELPPSKRRKPYLEMNIRAGISWWFVHSDIRPVSGALARWEVFSSGMMVWKQFFSSKHEHWTKCSTAGDEGLRRMWDRVHWSTSSATAQQDVLRCHKQVYAKCVPFLPAWYNSRVPLHKSQHCAASPSLSPCWPQATASCMRPQGTHPARPAV